MNIIGIPSTVLRARRKIGLSIKTAEIFIALVERIVFFYSVRELVDFLSQNDLMNYEIVFRFKISVINILSWS